MFDGKIFQDKNGKWKSKDKNLKVTESDSGMLVENLNWTGPKYENANVPWKMKPEITPTDQDE